jgi:hypothetical protein
MIELCNDLMQARPIPQDRGLSDLHGHPFLERAIVGAAVTFV